MVGVWAFQVARDQGQVAAEKVSESWKKISSKAMENERVGYNLTHCSPPRGVSSAVAQITRLTDQVEGNENLIQLQLHHSQSAGLHQADFEPLEFACF